MPLKVAGKDGSSTNEREQKKLIALILLNEALIFIKVTWITRVSMRRRRGRRDDAEKNLIQLSLRKQ